MINTEKVRWPVRESEWETEKYAHREIERLVDEEREKSWAEIELKCCKNERSTKIEFQMRIFPKPALRRFCFGKNANLQFRFSWVLIATSFGKSNTFSTSYSFLQFFFFGAYFIRSMVPRKGWPNGCSESWVWDCKCY